MSDNTTVPLGTLRRNDYNYRTAPLRHGGAVSMDVSSLADSIENVGLDNALTVRPLDNGTYEVVTGERRYHALCATFDDDYDVKVDIEELDDEQARERCFAENEERENLTTMQEAWGYAESVDVDYRGEDESFADYVGSLGVHVPPTGLHVPSVRTIERQGVSSVQLKGEAIRDRLSFLLLPDKAHGWLDDGDLTKRAARMISSKVRSGIDDPEAALDMMSDLVEDYGPENGAMRNTDYDDLSDDIKERIDTYHRRKDAAEEEVEAYRDSIFEHLKSLAGHLEAANEQFDTPYPVPQIGGDGEDAGSVGSVEAIEDIEDIDFDGITDGVMEYRDELDERSAALDNEADELQEERNDLQVRITKVQQVLNNHNDGACQYCQQSVDLDELATLVEQDNTRADRFRETIETIEAAINDIAETRSTLHRDKKKLETAHENYLEAYADAMAFEDGGDAQ